MAQFKIAFVAITLLFCLPPNGTAQQYQDRQGRTHLRDWQTSASSLRARTVTRSLAPSPHQIPNNSSPDITTRSRQRSPLRTHQIPPEEEQQPLADPRGRTSTRQRTPLKTLEDSLNTDWHQKRRDKADVVAPTTEFPTLRRRIDNVGVEPWRGQRQKSRPSEVAEGGKDSAPRGAFRGRITFQDTMMTTSGREAPKRSRSRDWRQQNAEAAEPREITRDEEPPAAVSAVSATPSLFAQQFQSQSFADTQLQIDEDKKTSGYKNDAIFPNLSTQQFSSDPSNQSPTLQQFPYSEPNQFEKTSGQTTVFEPPQTDQILRRIDSSNVERTPQFIPVEPLKGRNNFRSRARTTTTVRPLENGSEVTPNSSRSRQGAFRSRGRTGSTTEATAQQDKGNVPPRKMLFRGRVRAQSGLEAKERSFIEATEALTEQQQPAKPFRGSVTAKVTQVPAEDDIDTTANYPKEFLDKLKSSKKSVLPPKRFANSRIVPTEIGAPTARLKRKQYPTTENYSRNDADASESMSSENQQSTETSPVIQRYRFPKRLPVKTAPGNSEPQESSTSRKKNFKSVSPTTIKPLTTEPETSTTKQSNSTEERRKFVPKKKLTLEERKQRIARLKEKLRKNATEDELKTEESAFVRESLLLQANTHPGSREVVIANGKPHDSSSYDLISLGSEENARSVLVNKTTSSTTTAATATTEIATQAPPSTTSTPDFAVLNVTLFPSTRHRFSARINSTANVSLPPDVELIATTTGASALEQKPATLSVHQLFNSSAPTSTSASVSSTTAPTTPSTRSSSLTTTARTTSTTTKRSASKKKSSGRKKSKKPKSKAPAQRTTTKKPATSGGATSTVRPAAADSAATNSSNSAQPLSLPLSDVETIINDTLSVVNSNPMSGPSPAVAPRSELNALTPETLLNTTEATAALSNTNSSDNSTNQCANGTCTKSSSQSVHFNEPIPYARARGTTKSPDALRKIFVYGVFPNSTVLRKPFVGGQQGARPYSAPTVTPPTTSADYYVFGVYPNNSVVRRRGWKTFDYEKYHSPYVIFGIYPNNTIVKKYPNGTTINDEFMVSDNEIRKTVSEGHLHVHKGCTCLLNGVQTSESTTRKTTTTTTTAETSTERNAKDDAESFDVELQGISGTEQPETSGGTTTTESSAVEEEATVTTVSEGVEESTTESFRGSLSNAEEADMMSTPESQQESTTTASESDDGEGLENAEETDNASTPRDLEDSTSSLEREETQGGSLAEAEDRDKNDSTEKFDSDGLSEAEEADNGRQTERSDDIQESTTASSDLESTTEGRNEDIQEGTTARSKNEDRTTVENELLERAEETEKGTTAKSVDEEKTTAGSEDGIEGTTARTRVEERTTARSDYEEKTTTESELLERIEETDKGTTARSEDVTEGTTGRSTLEESTITRSEDSIQRTTARSEIEERTTTGNELLERIEETDEGSVGGGKTTARNEGIAGGTTERNELLERIEKIDEGTTTSNEVQDITEKAQEKTTVSIEDIAVGTTERNELFERIEKTYEGTTERNEVQEGTTTGDETLERIEKIDEGTTASSEVQEGTTARSESLERIEKIDEGTTPSNEVQEGTTARSESLERIEKIDEGTTPSNEVQEGATARSFEKIDEGTTASNEVFERTDKIQEVTTEGNELLERIEEIYERTTASNEVQEETTTRSETLESIEKIDEGTTASNEIYEGTTPRSELLNRIEKIDGGTTTSNEIEQRTTVRSEIFAEDNFGVATETITKNLDRTTKPQYPEDSSTEDGERIIENIANEGTTEGLEIFNQLTDTTAGYESAKPSADLEEKTTEDRQTATEQFGYSSLFGVGGAKSEERTTEQPNAEETTRPTAETDSRPSFIADLLPLKELTTEHPPFNPHTEKPSTEGTLIIDLNFDAVKTTVEEPSYSTGTEPTDIKQENVSSHTECPNRQPTTEPSFGGYVYERPTGNPFALEDLFGSPTDGSAGDTSEPPVVEAVTLPATTHYDIDVRELGGLIGRLTTAAFSQSDADSAATTSPPDDPLFKTLLTLESASGNALKKRHRKAVDDSDEPSSLTNLAYRALSSSETTPTPTPPPPLTARPKPYKIKNLSKTTVTAYKNLTALAPTPPPDDVFIVTPVASRDDPRPDHPRRGKVKFVTLTPGVLVTTDIHDDNDILTMSSQHVQKVTKAPAKIPDNFLSTVYGEIEEKASSPIPDILKNAENELQGDGLSASLARRIITLALEKAMTSTTPSSITTTTPSIPTIPPPTTSYIQRITTPEPKTMTTTKKHTTTTQKPTTTTKKPSTTTKKPSTTKKPKTTTRKPKQPKTTTSTTTTTTTTTTTRPTTTTETLKTVLITPKKATAQQLIKSPSAAITSPEFLGSTTGPEIADSQTAVVSFDPLTVYFPTEKPTPGSQKVTEDLNVLLSGVWQEQTSTTSKPKKKSGKSKSVLSKEASASLSESDLKILEAILQQQGANGATQDLEQIVQNQIRLAEEVRKASRNLKKKQRPTTTTTTERPAPLGLGFLLNLFGAGSRNNGIFSNEQRNSRRPRPVLSSFSSANASSVTPDPFSELQEEGSTTAERSARGELVSAAIDVTKAVSKFMGTVLTSAAQSFQNFFRNLGR